jgi:hypothetical protein
MSLKSIQSKLSTYNLWDEFLKQMAERRIGGIHRQTAYKAFREGPTTELLELIITVATRLVDEHEAKHNIGIPADQKYPSATA